MSDGDGLQFDEGSVRMLEVRLGDHEPRAGFRRGVAEDMMAGGDLFTDPWPRGGAAQFALWGLKIERDALRAELAKAQVEIERLRARLRQAEKTP